MGMEVILQKEPNIPGAHKLAQPFPALELRAETFQTLGFFLSENSHPEKEQQTRKHIVLTWLGQ